MSERNQPEGVAGLKKYKMKLSTIVFMIYALCAAGAFGTEDMIPVSGPGLTLVMLIVFPIIWAYPISLTVAELGSLLPAEGGIYVWVKEALGEFWGFMAGWWGTITIYLANAVYVVLIVAVLSQASMFNAYIASGSRGFFVLADDHLCPQFLAKVSTGRGVPYITIIMLAIVNFIMVNFDFSTLLVFLAPLGIISYIIMGVAARILRKKYPLTERKGTFAIPGGKVVFNLVTILPIVIGILGMLVNGTEYFLLGFVSLTSGVIAYLIFKRFCGGLYVLDPELHPINPKTKLAVGDGARIGAYFILVGLYAVFGSFFLSWYEGDWGAEYYLETYGSGLISNFELMIDVARYGGAAGVAIGIILFLASKKAAQKKAMKAAL